METSDRVSRAVAVAGTLTFLLVAFRALDLPETPFFSFACASAFLIFAVSSPASRELLILTVMTPLLALAYVVSGGAFSAGQYATLKDALGFLGLATFMVLAMRALRRTEALREYMIALAIPFATILTAFVLCLTALRQPSVYDLFLFRFDAAFGRQASVSVAQCFNLFPWLREICAIVYQALPLIMGLLIAASLKTGSSLAPLFKTFVAAGIAGCFFYLVLPAAGPAHVFGSNFPNRMPPNLELKLTTTANPVPRNCIPSLHLAWAILMLWNVPRRQRLVRAGLVLFLALTAIATLGLGEHYLVDLVTACPFAACVQTACAKRWRTATVTGAVTLLWIAYLRFGLVHIAPRIEIAWAASLCTIALAWWFGEDRRVHPPYAEAKHLTTDRVHGALGGNEAGAVNVMASPLLPDRRANSSFKRGI